VSHVIGVLKKEKQRLSSIIDDLEALAEVSPLSLQQIELKNQSNAKIACLLREEELKWYQRSKSKFILEKEIRILDTSIVLPMGNIGGNVFTLLSRMKVRSRGWIISNHT
jgi:hypothetical protein